MEGVGKEKISSGAGGTIIPEPVMEAAKRTSNNVEEVKAHLNEFLAVCDSDALSRMNPLQRAQSLMLLAKVTTNLFALRLRCNGVNPDEHPIKSELDRLSLYQEKVQRCVELNKAPLHPSATINSKAAARFIDHSLPDLTPEQKQGLREISRREGPTTNYLERNLHKKRKFQSNEKQSVEAAAQQFLEKAARELLGDNKSSFKGPIQIEESDDELLGDSNNNFSAPIVIGNSDGDGQTMD